MPDQLPVHLNRQELHSLEVPASFETDDSFVIAVKNHGEATRVHVHLADGLAEVASIDTSNHYVRANETAQIPVAIHGTGPAHGKLKLVSGYGAVTRWVDVTLVEQDDAGVEVDEDLAEPQPEPESTGGERLGTFGDGPGVPVLALGVVALVAAVAAAVLVQNVLVTLGAAVVLLALVVAGVILLR